jgi:hypothetical protein
MSHHVEVFEYGLGERIPTVSFGLLDEMEVEDVGEVCWPGPSAYRPGRAPPLAGRAVSLGFPGGQSGLLPVLWTVG